MDPSLFVTLAQAGLAGVGIFGLWHGYSLYKTQLAAALPTTEFGQNEYKRRHDSIRLFLWVSLAVTAMTGAIEIVKFFNNPQNEISLRLSHYSELEEKLRPKVRLGTASPAIDEFGVASMKTQNRDAVSVEIGVLVQKFDETKRNLSFANNQLRSNSNRELGHEDPN